MTNDKRIGRWEISLQLFRDYSAPGVKTATRADTMRQPHQSAVRTGDHVCGFQRVVRASLAAARFRMASFRIRHDGLQK